MTASKKNTAFRAAGLLLVLVLATSCFVGSTFAKYVTSGNGSDTARVAKFGVSVTGENTLFATKYEKTDENYTKSTFSVVAANASADENDKTTGDKVIAPGTQGEMTQFNVSGTPEVAVRVTFGAELSLKNWTVPAADGTKEYCPLVFTVNDTDYKMEAGESVADFENKVKTAIEKVSADYAPNTNLSDAGQNLNVSWEWPFQTSAENDVKDTALGDAETPAQVTLTVSATVTQID